MRRGRLDLRGSIAVLLLAIGACTGCSGGSDGTAGAPATAQVTVDVTPATAAISTLQTLQLTAVVRNASNLAVTWSVDGVPGGNAALGVIGASGLYAPSSGAATRLVVATSVEDPSRSASASITVVAAAAGVGVTPATPVISTIRAQQFTATVGGGGSQQVRWLVDGIDGGNAEVGFITAAGLYSPPGRASSHLVTAVSVADATRAGTAQLSVTLLEGTLTHKNDNARTGQNLRERTLTPRSVRPATFGRIGSLPVDGYVYAQPLYVADVPVAGVLHDVVIVATEHNSVYAFDARATGAPALWQRSLSDPANGITAVPFRDTATPPGYAGPGYILPDDCADLTPEIGITGTPVIDPVTGTIFVVAKTREVRGAAVAWEHRLHALDLATGASRPGSGEALRAAVPGSTLPNAGGNRVVFQALRQNQRAALLLSDGIVSIAFSSHCTIAPYQGWVLAYDARTLDAVGAFNVAPDHRDGKGGIWHSGGGPAADAAGNVFVMTGDGPFDADTGGTSYGDSVLKLARGSLALADHFTPYNHRVLETTNADMSAGGPLLLPDQAGPVPRLMVAAGKQGIVYLLDRDDMGGFQPGSDSQVVQSFPGGVCGAGACPFFGSPAYFNGRVYTVAVADRLKAYALTAGRLAFARQSGNAFPWPGASPTISANGTADGIVWALESNGSGAPAVLRAYLAEDVATELYASNRQPARDDPGAAVKFVVPTVAAGQVFVGGQHQVAVFGLLAP